MMSHSNIKRARRLIVYDGPIFLLFSRGLRPIRRNLRHGVFDRSLSRKAGRCPSVLFQRRPHRGRNNHLNRLRTMRRRPRRKRPRKRPRKPRRKPAPATMSRPESCSVCSRRNSHRPRRRRPKNPGKATKSTRTPEPQSAMPRPAERTRPAGLVVAVASSRSSPACTNRRVCPQRPGFRLPGCFAIAITRGVKSSGVSAGGISAIGRGQWVVGLSKGADSCISCLTKE